MTDNLAKTSIRGIGWTMLRVLGQTGIGFGVGIFLARTLEIKDFGLMAIAMSVIGLAELISSLGVEASLIQRPTLTRKHLEVAFTLSLLMATLLLLLFWLAGPGMARFFDQPALAQMLPVLGIGQWFATVAMVPRAALRRRFDFKLLSKIELGAYLVGYATLSVLLVLLGFGVWSLVIATCAWFFIASILMFLAANLSLRPGWGQDEVRDLLSFGLLMTSKSAINYAAVSSTNFIVGKFVGVHGLGLYARAEQVAMLPLQKIASVFSSVMFPVYSSIQNDKERLAGAYLKTVAAVCLLTAPPMAVAAVFSEIVIIGLYGEKWTPAAGVFSILCISSIFICVFHLAGALVEATNHIWGEIKRQIVYFLIIVVGFYFAAQSGIIAVSLVFLFGALFLYVAMGQLSLKIIGRTWLDYLKVQAPGILLALILAGIGLLALPQLNKLHELSHAIKLIIVVAGSATLYSLLIYLMPDRWVFGAKQMILEKFLKKRTASAASEA